MSVDPTPCRECGGKFGPGPICAVCDSLHKLGVWLRSPRCPEGVGRSSVEKVREVQRSLLEEAEVYWAANLGTESVPGGLKGKACTPVPPPRASEGDTSGGRASGSGASRERGGTREVVPPRDSQVRRSQDKEHQPRGSHHHHQRHRHHKSRSRSRRAEKSKRRSVTRSPLPRSLPSKEVSPRVKKERGGEASGAREVSRSPYVEVKEEEADYGDDDEEEEEEESEQPRVEGSPERSPAPRRARTPSRSPRRRSRWEGPIPAGHRRTNTAAFRAPPADSVPKRKRKKKNKGKAKKERQKQWVRNYRENRRRY